MIGFKGRTTIAEAIIVDENIENALQTNPSEREIKKAAQNQKLLDLSQDGVIKVLQGITTLDELRRIIDIEKE